MTTHDEHDEYDEQQRFFRITGGNQSLFRRKDNEGVTESFRIADRPGLSAALDQQRASIREQLRREQPWRRDLRPPADLPVDPFF